MFRPFVGQGCALSGYQGRRLAVCPGWGNCAKTLCAVHDLARLTLDVQPSVLSGIDHLQTLQNEKARASLAP